VQVELAHAFGLVHFNRFTAMPSDAAIPCCPVKEARRRTSRSRGYARRPWPDRSCRATP
jgi:hypothetical protein